MGREGKGEREREGGGGGGGGGEQAGGGTKWFLFLSQLFRPLPPNFEK